MTDNSADIIVLNGLDKQSVELLWQQEVVLDIDATLFYIKSGEKEIQTYVETVAKPDIENFTRQFAAPIVADVVTKQSATLINSYVESTTKPEIITFADKALQPYVNDASQEAGVAKEAAVSAAASAEKASLSADNAFSAQTSASASATSAASAAAAAAAKVQEVQNIAVQQGEISELQQKVAALQACRYAVESYHNGTEWYCLYSDGWIEQGGAVSLGSGWETKNLLKPFSDTLYYINCYMVSGGSATNFYFGDNKLNGRTATTFTIGTGQSEGAVLAWFACGY